MPKNQIMRLLPGNGKRRRRRKKNKRYDKKKERNKDLNIELFNPIKEAARRLEELKIEFSRGYKLHLKFDDAEINKMKNDEKIEDILSNLKELAFGVDAFESEILENKNVVIENYLVNLIEILNQIKDKTKKIEINDIRKDMSFELGIEIIKERQKDLFVQVLNLKNVNIKISELSITMQSLENILTSLN